MWSCSLWYYVADSIRTYTRVKNRVYIKYTALGQRLLYMPTWYEMKWLYLVNVILLVVLEVRYF
jgi:hypothetical protein